MHFLADGWHPFLGEEFKKPYMENIRELLRSELKNRYQVFPPKDKIFRALKLVDFYDVKVVILGQDPYHGAHQANGLAFAVENGVPNPPSLMNIFKEIKNDIQCQANPNSNLEHWAKQGVLLLNTVLTVKENTAFSHRGKGWETFTDKVISSLNEKKSPAVFLLWGSAAQAKSSLITNSIHKILNAPHPSPLSAHRGFLGCKHFSKTNDFLKQNNLTPINWF
ncbi:MAG: uracil-DNA glycosylase [Bdellovibrionota bacterium]